MKTNYYLTAKDTYFFYRALAISAISNCKFQHGCIVTVKNKPVTYGFNVPKVTHIQKKYYKSKLKCNQKAHKRRIRQETTHAEIAALRKIKGALSGAVLYSARCLKNGNPGDSYPCDACMQIIEICKIKSVIYWKNGIMQKVSL